MSSVARVPKSDRSEPCLAEPRASSELTSFVSNDSIGAMPTVLRIGPYRFRFYSREGAEPPHIHVARDDFEAKFWLRPVELAANNGFPAAEVREVGQEHCEELIAAYVRTHGHN